MLKAILDMGPDEGLFSHLPIPGRLQRRLCGPAPVRISGGVRRVEGPIRAIRYGLADEGKYIEGAYEKVLKIAQIETMEGYENLDEMPGSGRH